MASSSATPILCSGGDSTVTITASGGTGPYTGTGSFTVESRACIATRGADHNGLRPNAARTLPSRGSLKLQPDEHRCEISAWSCERHHHRIGLGGAAHQCNSSGSCIRNVTSVQ
jgi:hypothetical protein